MRLLVIEDHRDLVRSLFDYFEPRGHIMDTAPDGRTGLALALEQHYDAIILDWNLPRMDGIDVLRAFHEQGGTTPVILLTARDDVMDKVEGFRTGANDYLTKPFTLPELEVRLEALVRKSAAPAARVLTVGDLQYDLSAQRVTRGGRELHVYPACRKLLESLMRASPAAISREELEHIIWADDLPDADRLRSHIYDLRRAIDGPFDVKLLHTLPRIGYRLAENGDA